MMTRQQLHSRIKRKHYRQLQLLLRLLAATLAITNLSRSCTIISIVAAFLSPQPTAVPYENCKRLLATPKQFPHCHNSTTRKQPTLHRLEESAAEFQEALALATSSSLLADGTDVKNNGRHLNAHQKSMDSIPCLCDEQGEDSKRQHYDDVVKQLFISLVQKVGRYNPEAVEGIDLSSFVDDDSLTVEDIHNMAANDKKFESHSSKESLGTQLVRAYQYAKAAHRGQCRKSGEPYISE